MDDGQALGAQVAVDRAMTLTSMTPFSDAERQAIKEQVALYKWIATKYDASMYGDKKAGVTDMIPAIIVPPALGPGINPQTTGSTDSAADQAAADQANRQMPTLGENLQSTFGDLREPNSASASLSQAFTRSCRYSAFSSNNFGFQFKFEIFLP